MTPIAAQQTPPAASWWKGNILVLGLVSLFTDDSSEMIMPLLPIFLTTTLGAGAVALGIVEGIAEASASILKWQSGRWSDKLGKRKPFVVAGYSVSTLARPLMSLAGSVTQVVFIRASDRVGKGLRTSARDALLAGAAEPAQRGRAFSFHRAMDHTGAVIGPLLAIAFLSWVSHDLRLLFAVAAIPGIFAVAVAVFKVRESAPITQTHPIKNSSPSSTDSLRGLLIPLALFTLGNASDTFLLLKAGESRASLITLPLLWLGLHLVKIAASMPGGLLADHWGRRKTIALGWIFYALVYAGFAMATTTHQVAILFIAYGIFHGLTEGSEKALVADLSKRMSQGSSFGWYHLTLGMGSLMASLMFGLLWQRFGSASAFFTSAGLAFSACLLLAWMRPPSNRAVAY